MDKENENLLQNIMNFHIHPIESLTDDPDMRLDFSDDSAQTITKLNDTPRFQSWRRHSEGAITLANKPSRKGRLLPEIPQPLPLSRLWLQGPKLDGDTGVINYSIKNPAAKVLNLDKSYLRGRSRDPDRKALQRLNISPVRNNRNRESSPRVFTPPSDDWIRLSSRGNSSLSSERTKLDSDPLERQFSDYCDLNDIRMLRDSNEYRKLRDSVESGSRGSSNSKTSSDQSERSETSPHIVSISADAILRKINCPLELYEPRKIANQHLKNCRVTYIPENGNRFVTYIANDSEYDEMQNQYLAYPLPYSDYDNSARDFKASADNQPGSQRKISRDTEPKESNSNTETSYQSPLIIPQKNLTNNKQAPLKSLTSRAIPIDSPILEPKGLKPLASCTPNTTKKGYFFRKKQPVRQTTNCSSYAPSFQDSTIMAQFQPVCISDGHSKFNRVPTNHHKSSVSNPASDFRKEVKRIMYTPQGYLKHRLVQMPGGHPKYIAYHIPKNVQATHGSVKPIENRIRSKYREPIQKKLAKPKNYAVVLPNIHHLSGYESTPIYFMSSRSAHYSSLSNEVDA